MQPLSKREKILISFNVVLVVLVLLLLYKVIDYNLNVFEIKHDFTAPLSMVESIKSANLIFKCENKISGDTLECFIDQIIYKDESFNFPFGIGDSFPPKKGKVQKNVDYGSGSVFFLSSKSNNPSQSVTIYNGILKGFGNISAQEFIATVNEIKGHS